MPEPGLCRSQISTSTCKEKMQKISLLFFLQFPLLQAAKILTLCFVGGSHYLLMDEITRILHTGGHDVRMFLQYGDGMLPGRPLQQSPYPISSYSLDEEYIQQHKELFTEHQKDYLMGRNSLESFLIFLDELAYQCNITLHQSDILNFLKEEKYDLAVLDAFNPCALMVAEKLGLPFIAVFPGIFLNARRVRMTGPVSYVPVFGSELTDRMDFFGRLKNTFMSLGSRVVDSMMDARFEKVLQEHFPADSRPSIDELHLKAELWLYNIDFTIEYPRPLLPHIQYIGGLLAKPAKPVTQDLEDFISESGNAGFIVVTLGSMLSSLPVPEFLKEMNDGFSKIPQKVIWRYEEKRWPRDVTPAHNVRLVDWLPQNDLLGHLKVRLLVTHGGMNSLSEAVYHGVPVLGIPLFGDQYENLVRIKARNMGTFLPPDQMKAKKFANILQEIIENSRYRTSAVKQRTILRSRPFPPDQQVLGWVEHIIQSGGGGHLKPYSYQQPWYQQLLLDVIFFIFCCVALIIFIIWKVLRFLIHLLCSRKKQKQN